MADRPDAGLGPETGDYEGDAGESAEASPETAATVELLYPGFVPTAFYRFHQTSFPRRWCLTMITWPYLFCTSF